MNVYLDNAATTKLSPAVKEYIISLLDTYSNPSSVYESGIQAKRMLNQARYNVAKFINAKEREITFTSSGSASNTLGIKGYCDAHVGDYSLYYSAIAHKSIQMCAKAYNGKMIPVDKYGVLDHDWLFNELYQDTCENKLVVFDYANSEIGTIQPVSKIIKTVHFLLGTCLIDCTGSISTIPLDVKQLDADMVSFSAHKLGSLKGVGVLYKKPDINLSPLVYGSQENGLFGGTENFLGIMALGKAVEDYCYNTNSSEKRDYVYSYIKKFIPQSYLIGSAHRLQNNLYMCFRGVSGESLMILLDSADIQVSTGSACSSGDNVDSPTLLAIGMNTDDIRSCIRMSFNGTETEAELDYVCAKLKQNVKALRILNGER